jgi:hypothetical protein
MRTNRKTKKNKDIRLQNSTRIYIPDNIWESFKEKDLYTTTEIIDAIHATFKLGMSIIISYPIPIQMTKQLCTKSAEVSQRAESPS